MIKSKGIIYLEEGERLPGQDKHERLRKITVKQHNKMMYGLRDKPKATKKRNQ